MCRLGRRELGRIVSAERTVVCFYTKRTKLPKDQNANLQCFKQLQRRHFKNQTIIGCQQTKASINAYKLCNIYKNMLVLVVLFWCKLTSVDRLDCLWHCSLPFRSFATLYICTVFIFSFCFSVTFPLFSFRFRLGQIGRSIVNRS